MRLQEPSEWLDHSEFSDAMPGERLGLSTPTASGGSRDVAMYLYGFQAHVEALFHAGLRIDGFEDINPDEALVEEHPSLQKRVVRRLPYKSEAG